MFTVPTRFVLMAFFSDISNLMSAAMWKTTETWLVRSSLSGSDRERPCTVVSPAIAMSFFSLSGYSSLSVLNGSCCKQRRISIKTFLTRVNSQSWLESADRRNQVWRVNDVVFIWIHLRIALSLWFHLACCCLISSIKEGPINRAGEHRHFPLISQRRHTRSTAMCTDFRFANTRKLQSWDKPLKTPTSTSHARRWEISKFHLHSNKELLWTKKWCNKSKISNNTIDVKEIE